MHTMVESQVFCCSVQVDDICSGDAFRSGSKDRGSEYKMRFDTGMPLSDQEYPLFPTLTSALFMVDKSINNLKSGCLTLSDDLACFNAVHQHQAINTDRRKFKCLPHFVYINAMLEITKISLKRVYHAFNFNNTLCGVLFSFPIFLVGVHNKTFRERLPSGGRHNEPMLGFVRVKPLAIWRYND